MTPLREPPSAARIREIRRSHETDDLDFAAFASEAGTTLAEQYDPWHVDRADLLGALDYCRKTLEIVAVMQDGDYADDAITRARRCIERLFWEEPR